MDDPYATLGVQKTDSAETIRAAYRKLAKRFHPDLNPDKPEAAERFKAIGSAYALLSDADKRARFDRGEIDAAGQERAPERPYYRRYAEDPGRGKYRSGRIDPEDLASMFGQGFGGGFGGGFGDRAGGGEEFAFPGGDSRYGLAVSFVDAALGAKRRIVLPDGRTLDVTIPPGIADGAVMRLRGQGEPGHGGAPAGDALIEITVAADPRFRRDGDDVVATLPVTLKEAVLGAAIDVPTVHGDVRLTIPPGSGSGTRLRLRDRGIGAEGRRGHHYVLLEIRLPKGEEPELAAFLRDWTPRHDQNPRGTS